jgi:hypothetical protein
MTEEQRNAESLRILKGYIAESIGDRRADQITNPLLTYAHRRVLLQALQIERLMDIEIKLSGIVGYLDRFDIKLSSIARN